jgi:deoxyribose-phosphate aldolase
MENTEFAARIDHTVLGPETTPADVRRVLDEATEYGTNACVPPCYVAEAAAYAPSIRLVTVAGFPHGQEPTPIKVRTAVDAVRDGADEVDVVVNVGRLKAGEDEAVRDDIAEITAAVSVPVKVIVEAPLLDASELRRIAELAVEADADYLKTATGFADPSEGPAGATVADVELLSEYLPVKASGGIGGYERARELLDAGAERIGASSGATIVAEYRDR